MVIIHMEAVKKMRNKIYKYGLGISIFVFAFFSILSYVNASYGEDLYGSYLYSETEPAPSTGSHVTGTSQAIRTQFFAEQQAKLATATTTTTTVTPTSTTSTSLTIAKTLKLNMEGDEVKKLQVYLNTHGYPIATTGAGSLGNETNRFGGLTKAAVVKFQLANGLTGDGVVGPKTIELMNKTQTTTTTAKTSTSSSTDSEITKNLKSGMVDIQVKYLQIYLNTHGYPVATTGAGSLGNETNRFGPATEKAVISFQKASGISPVDGIVGPQTRALLK